MPFYLLSMSQGNELLTFALAVATFSCGYAAANAVWPSFYGEMFSTKVRFSGMAIGTQLGFLMAGFAPTIVTALGGVEPGGWVVSAIFTAVIAADRDRRGPDRPGDQGRADRGAGSASGRGRPPLRADLELTSAGGDGDRGRGSPSSSGIQDTDPVSDLFWPGDERAGSLLSDAELLRADGGGGGGLAGGPGRRRHRPVGRRVTRSAVWSVPTTSTRWRERPSPAATR